MMSSEKILELVLLDKLIYNNVKPEELHLYQNYFVRVDKEDNVEITICVIKGLRFVVRVLLEKIGTGKLCNKVIDVDCTLSGLV